MNGLLEPRLADFGVTRFDVGSVGKSYFRAVAQNVYGDPILHPFRQANRVECPKRFTEFHPDNSWLSYVNSMTLDGTWADHMVIQAVADSFNLPIGIVESTELYVLFLQVLMSTQ